MTLWVLLMTSPLPQEVKKIVGINLFHTNNLYELHNIYF